MAMDAVVGVCRRQDILEVAIRVFELWTEQPIVAMVLLNWEKYAMIQIHKMEMDETAAARLKISTFERDHLRSVN